MIKEVRFMKITKSLYYLWKTTEKNPVFLFFVIFTFLMLNFI